MSKVKGKAVFRSSPNDNSREFMTVSLDGTDINVHRVDGNWALASIKDLQAWVRVDQTDISTNAGSVPYISQWGIGANIHINDCGIASAAMLAASKGVKINIDEQAKKWDAPDDGTTPHDLVNLLASVGVAAEVMYGLNPRTPAICLGYYSAFSRSCVWDKKFYGAHWLVKLYDEGDYTVAHDPDYLGNDGAFKKYLKSEFNNYLASYGYTSVVLK